MGEVAAAEAAGILTRADATRLIYLRSKHQEKVRGLGRMMVVAAEAREGGATSFRLRTPELEIAATTTARPSTTLSGPGDLLKSFAKHCRSRVSRRSRSISFTPSHSSALAPFEKAMVADLSIIHPKAGTSRFLSAVTGEEIAGEKHDANYWWQNIRQEVRFADAVRAAAGSQQKTFVEISPRAILTARCRKTSRCWPRGRMPHDALAEGYEAAVDLVVGR